MAYPSPMQSAGYTHHHGMPVSFNYLKKGLRPSGSSYIMQRDGDSMTSPFGQNSHGHPKFNPKKLGTTLTVNPRAALKSPKAPEKPGMPYMRYSRKVRDQVKAVNQELKLWDISKVIGQMWKDLPGGEKQHYADEYEVGKAEYDRNHKVYLVSPAYQAYMTAKSKVSSTTNDKGASSTIRKVYVGAVSDRCFEIQPAEDEEDMGDGMSVEHVAHAKYMRNHRLVHKIVSDVVVHDVRSVVTSSRMMILKRYLLSLTLHQKRLETELHQIEEKCESKKRKFMESVPAFQDELVRTHRKPIDEEFFQLMVEQKTDIIKKERERERERQIELVKQREAAAALVAANPPLPPAGEEPIETEEITAAPAVGAAKEEEYVAMETNTAPEEVVQPSPTEDVPALETALPEVAPAAQPELGITPPATELTPPTPEASLPVPKSAQHTPDVNVPAPESTSPTLKVALPVIEVAHIVLELAELVTAVTEEEAAAAPIVIAEPVA